MRVALTGGIATGKSTVGGHLRARGIAVIDADQLARAAVAPGSAGLRQVAELFGPHLVSAEGRLDRAALGRMVFADAAARRRLEGIVHPRVREGIARFFAEAGDAAAVAEVPLLYEANWQNAFDAVVVAACRPDTQRRRLASREDLSPEAIDQRLAAQWPIEHKARVADFVIVTDGSLEETAGQAARMGDWLLAWPR
jgi:dephospho-CoA kinase